MANRAFEFSVDEYYHIYNRGTDKRLIFLDEYDRNRFQILLYLCNNKESIEMRLFQGKTIAEIFGHKRGEQYVNVGSYCLMPNHFHILLHEKEENGISSFMTKLLTAYSMYFNKKYQRTGSLFEGKFKATHADDDEYLKYLFSYIHLNPIKLLEPLWKERGITNVERAEEFLKTYPFSSYVDFLGEQRSQLKILNPGVFPDYFSSPVDFENIHKDRLIYKDIL